jgi:hypothetical protein
MPLIVNFSEKFAFQFTGYMNLTLPRFWLFSFLITSHSILRKCLRFCIFRAFFFASFIPRHNDSHFSRPQSCFGFLLPYKSAAQPIPRTALVLEMYRNIDFARFTILLLPNAIKLRETHRTLVAFNAATMQDFISHSRTHGNARAKLDEGVVVELVDALLVPLKAASDSAIDATTVIRESIVSPTTVKTSFLRFNPVYSRSWDPTSFSPHCPRKFNSHLVQLRRLLAP